MKTVNVGLVGVGTVGRGVCEVLRRNCEEISRRTGREIIVSAASARNVRKAEEFLGSTVKVYEDPFDVVRDKNVDIVIELIGGTTTARALIEESISLSKPVVTANKALIAEHGNELFSRARANGSIVAYEAAVAGGIPIIKALREGLAANRIDSVAGIVNGTTNFILSEMRDKGISFQDALADAQQLGYAEADPTFDIEGIDTAHKLVILSAIAQNNKIDFDNISIEGITKITIDDINFAKEFGYKIKLVGIFEDLNNGQIMQNTYPALVPAGSHIGPIDDSYNALLIKGNNSDWNLSVGRGAGEFPTASAVIADVIDIANDRYTHPLGAKNSDLGVSNITDLSSRVGKYYLRFIADNNPDFIKSQFKNDIIENFTAKEDGDKIIYGVFTKSIAEKEILSLKEKFVNDNNFIFIRIENI